MDYEGVDSAVDERCLDFRIDKKVHDIAKPSRLVLEFIPQSIRDSFLLLELAELTPSGVCEINPSESREELVDLGNAHYVSRSAWDGGFYGYYESDREKPLPRTARLVTRWLRGKILIVAKGSLWNGDPATYDGRHSHLSAFQIRGAIERALSR